MHPCRIVGHEYIFFKFHQGKLSVKLLKIWIADENFQIFNVSLRITTATFKKFKVVIHIIAFAIMIVQNDGGYTKS